MISPQRAALVNEMELHLKHGQTCIERCDWEGAIAHFRPAGEIAIRLRRQRGIMTAGLRLEKLGDYREAARFLALGRRMKSDITLPEWDGTRQHGRTLLIEPRNMHIGQPIRLARLIAPAAARVRRCVVLAERRMVPLLRRTFTDVDVRTQGEDDADARLQADVVAAYETLWQHFGPNEASIRGTFSPLRPDWSLVETLRSRYATHSNCPCIGISWASTNTDKEMPRVEDWAAFVGTQRAKFVSLQYGNISADLSVLRAGSQVSVIEDPAVDQLSDLDTFAAQIAALDAVVTISNTPAHLAGALAIPTFVILGDKIPTSWPFIGSSPWFPHTILVRRSGRAWNEVFREISTALDQRFALKPVTAF